MLNEFELIAHDQTSGVHAFLIDMNYRRPHLHTDLEWIYVLDGQLTLTIENQTLHMKHGELIVINSCQLHELTATETAKLLILQLNTKEFDAFFPQINELSFAPQVLSNHNNTHFQALRFYFFKTCLAFFEEQAYVALECHGYASLALAELLQSATFERIPENKQGAHLVRQERIRRISQYIYQHYPEKIRLETLAKQEELSVNYLSHFFQQNFGVSFQNYLNMIRCEKAHYLLTHTEHSILAISEMTGFSDMRYLNKAFKMNYHLSPKDYRNQQKTKSVLFNGPQIGEQQMIHSKFESIHLLKKLFHDLKPNETPSSL